MQILKRHKGIIMAGALIVLFTSAFLLGTVYMRHQTEKKVQAASMEAFAENGTVDDLSDGGTDDQVAISRELAEYYLEHMPDAPLLQENAKENEENWGDSSLENVTNDVNATKGAKEAILRICEEAGIDAATAKVSDLTVEQIIEIDQEVYQNSDHPKD